MKNKQKTGREDIQGHPANFNRKALPLAIAVACAQAIPVVNAAELEEVIVTATRRDQSVMDVPYNISAFTADDLDSSRVYDINEIARMVPGLVNLEQGPSARGNNNNYILRGLNANSLVNNVGIGTQTVSPVSIYIGETPMFFPIAVKDIERVEVLRGPQGTLYGSGSAGGTVRILPNRPDFEDVAWDVNASISSTTDAGDPNYSIDSVLNVPVGDEAAFRVVAGYEQLAGFIDANGLVSRTGNAPNSPAVPAVPGDAASGFVLLPRQEDANDADDWFVRASWRWQPTDNVDVQINYHHQETTQDTQQAINENFAGGPIDISAEQVPGSLFMNAYAPIFQYYGFTPYPNGSTTFRANGERTQSGYILEPYERDVDLVNLDAKVDFGFATFTSASSFYSNDSDQTRDVTGFGEITPTPGGGSLATFYGYFPRLLLIDRDVSEEESFVQEFRLASNWDKNWNFVVGAYYQDLENELDFDQFTPGVGDFRNSAAGSPFFDFFLVPLGFTGSVAQPDDAAFLIDRTFEFEDVALFGEVSFDINERWQVTGGVRAFWQDFSNSVLQQFPFCSSACANDLMDPLGTSVLGAEESFQDQIFKLNTSFQFNDDLLGYFTWAEGFRRGGANAIGTSGLFASLPDFQIFEPDKATNWELGLKGSLGDNVAFTVAGFFIQWEEFQFDDFTPAGLIAVFNGRDAETKGVEFSANGQLSDAFSFNVGYSYTDAETTEGFTVSDFPLGGALLGLDPIPFFTVNDGDPLPGVPEHTATLTLQYEQALANNGWSINYHLNGSYRSDADSQFNSEVAFGRQFFTTDSYSIWDASVTLDTANWSVGIFGNNLFDEDGISGGVPAGAFAARGEYFYATRPQTIGIALSYRHR